MIKTFRFVYALMLVTLSVISYKASAEEKTLSWQAPVTRVDGSVLRLEEISGYELRYGGFPEATKYKEVSKTKELFYKINLTAPGKYCFQGRTVLVLNTVKSAWSKEACTTIELPLPKPLTLGIN